MSRSKNFIKRKIKPDLIYNSCIIAKIINCVMKCGKKQLATNIVYKALLICKNKTNEDILHIINTVIKKLSPEVWLRKRKVASMSYQIPVAISDTMSISIAIKWLINGAKSRNEYGYINKLSSEILDVYLHNKGVSIKSKQNYQMIAENNKAFVHYLS